MEFTMENSVTPNDLEAPQMEYKQDYGAPEDNVSNEAKGADSNEENARNDFKEEYSQDNDNEEAKENSENGNNKRVASEFDAPVNINSGNNYQKRQKTGGFQGVNNMNRNNNNYGNRNREAGVELRILLPSKDAGAIIGRGGANIKKLRQEHKTQIQVPDCNGPERLLLISGDIDTCINALLDIIPLLEENQKFNNNESGSTELRLLVHQSQAGCIIGRGGDKIKDLRIKHNLDMKVYSECAPMSTERVCQMKGKSPDIVNCLREAIALLESAPPKGMSRPYDPHSFDEFLSSQYGGFTNDKRASNMGGNRMGNNHGGRSGFNNNSRNNSFDNNTGGFNRDNNDGFNNGGNNGGYNNNGMNRGGRGGYMRGNDRGINRVNMSGSMNRGGMSNNQRGGMGGNYNNRGGMNNRGSNDRSGFNTNNNGGNRAGYNNNNVNSGNHNYTNNQNVNQVGNTGGNTAGQTNQVTIPNELAGAVIGPKGSKIQQIRDQSGAGITIDKPTPGSNDRIITINGTPEQIQNAQYLLQVTVKQSGLWQGQ